MSQESGLHYDPAFVSPADRAALVAWLASIQPIWENRHTDRRKPREGQKRRRLLRPVYWLGGWQFACLNYYARGARQNRVVTAESFCPTLARLIERIENHARKQFAGQDMPDGWHLNTALINFYGLTHMNDRWVDTARVGGHRDHEPGPIASMSLGAPARFQFTETPKGSDARNVAWEQWLGDSSMLLFGGERFKNELFHRVPQVRRKTGHAFDLGLDDFRCNRVNFTLRYVPTEHIIAFDALPDPHRSDVARYVDELGKHSAFWKGAAE